MSKLNANYFSSNFHVFTVVLLMVCGGVVWAFLSLGEKLDENVTFKEKVTLIASAKDFIEKGVVSSKYESLLSQAEVQRRMPFITALGVKQGDEVIITWGEKVEGADVNNFSLSTPRGEYRALVQTQFSELNEGSRLLLGLVAGSVVFVVIVIIARLTIIKPIRYVLDLTEMLSDTRKESEFSLRKWFLMGRTRAQLQYLHHIRDKFIEREKEVVDIRQRLNHSTSHDFLTGLPNQHLFYHLIAQTIGKGVSDKKYGLLYIDLDGFGAINELNGHKFGDGVLKNASRRVDSFRKKVSGLCGRTQGDTFMVFTEVESENHLKNLGLEVLEIMAGDYEIGDVKVNITAVVGGAVLAPNETINDVLEKVHTAVYAAKRNGRACYMAYKYELRESHARRARIRQELITALENEKLTVHFQPIMNLNSGTVAGVEALVRWFDSNNEPVYRPDEFISIAEESGFIGKIDKMVLDNTCRMLHRVNSAGFDIFASVNMSPANFNRGEAVSLIQKALQKTHIAPEKLEIEITERSILNQEGALDQLSEVRAMGVGVSIDDFGVGYSSLASVREYSSFITKLKLDKAFIDALNDQSDDVSSQIVDVIFGLARSMKVKAVAEGVETLVQNDRLIQLGCEYGQGWLFEKAISERTLVTLLESERTRLVETNRLIPSGTELGDANV